MGPDLMAEMRAQAEQFGAEIIQGHVTAVDSAASAVHGRARATPSITATTLIIATGASARLLGLPSERALMGHGVSTCATCDGYFFRGQDDRRRRRRRLGDGRSDLPHAVRVSKVTVVHRRDTLRASKIMQDKARANPKIALDAGTAEVDEIKDTAARAR